MSNPTLLVEDFAGDAGAFSVTGAERYAVASSSRINYWPDPLCQGATGLTNGTNGSFSSSSDVARQGTTSYKFVCNGAGDGGYNFNWAASSFPPVPLGTSVAISFWVYANAGAAGKTFRCQVNNLGGATGESEATGGGATVGQLTLVEGWQKFTKVVTTLHANRTRVLFLPRLISAANNDTFYIDEVLIELSGSVNDWLSGSDDLWIDPRLGVIATGQPSLAATDANGLWLESAATNLVTNPWFATNTTGWSASNGAIARSVNYAYQGTAAGVLTASAANATATISISATATDHIAHAIVQNTTNASRSVRLHYDGSPIGSAVVLAAGERAEITAPFTGTGGAANLSVVVSDSANTNPLVIFYLGAYAGTVAGSPLPAINPAGTIRPGYSWTSTAHNSTSARAASSASISPTGIFDTYLGAIVFVATPTIETGAEEIWGELGEKLAGADHIRWGRDSTKHPFVEWSGNDSAYTRVTLTATVDAGDEHFYSIEWHVGDADFRLYLDDDPSENDTIPSPQEDYGAGPLKLQATAGGVVYSGLMICNARLTDAQRARLQEVDHWSVRTLGRLRVEVARPQFELRPAY